MMTDTSAFFGPWPFGQLPTRSADELARHLRAHGIDRALVSHLGAVFPTDPMPANRALFAATRRRSKLVPAPILNPGLAVWAEHLDECCRLAPALRAVRIVPAYHDTILSSHRVAEFVSTLESRRLRLIVTVRLADARLDYFGLKLRRISMAELSAFLRAFPRLHPLLSGLMLPELRTLLRTGRRFSADIPFVEWLYSLESVVAAGARRRLMFGSNTPFFVTEANAAKLRDASIAPQVREDIAWRNAARFFSLPI